MRYDIRISTLNILLDYFLSIRPRAPTCLIGGNPLKKMFPSSTYKKGVSFVEEIAALAADGDTMLFLVKTTFQIILPHSPHDKENGGCQKKTVPKSI